MITFKQHIVEQKNTHMTHSEDSVLYGGVEGVRSAIMSMRALRDMLNGNVNKSYDQTLKWDGAPAVFAGIDPSDGKFFVAKKGIFNKSPMVYKTNADIDNDTSGDLNAKLKLALAELPKLGITGVVQGDFLFSNADLKSENIDGEDYITFHPNTIVYAVQAAADEAKKMQAAKIGIVWHTSYSGSSFENMSAKYGVDSSKFRKVKSVYSIDAGVKNLSGTVTLTTKDYNEVTKALSLAGKAFNKVKSKDLKLLLDNKKLANVIEIFSNSKVREGKAIDNPAKHAKDFYSFAEARFDKEVDKVKTPAAKERKQQEKEDNMRFYKSLDMVSLFGLQKGLVEAKIMLLSKISNLTKSKTFVKTSDGFKVTGHEGLVVIDKTSGGAYKLVDRLEFSKNNFSADIIKGWESSRRG